MSFHFWRKKAEFCINVRDAFADHLTNAFARTPPMFWIVIAISDRNDSNLNFTTKSVLKQDPRTPRMRPKRHNINGFQWCTAVHKPLFYRQGGVVGLILSLDPVWNGTNDVICQSK